MPEHLLPANTVAKELACPRCSKQLYQNYPDEPPSCLICGYVSYGDAGREFDRIEKVRLLKNVHARWGAQGPLAQGGKASATNGVWEALIHWKKQDYLVKVRYIKEQGSAMVLDIQGPFLEHIRETTSMRVERTKHATTVLISDFNLATGMRLTYVEPWLKENGI